MRLLCLHDYAAFANGERLSYRKGQTIDVSDLLGTWLLVDSPGSFEVRTAGLDEAVDEIAEETPTGLTVPDRRMRGGRRRN